MLYVAFDYSYSITLLAFVWTAVVNNEQWQTNYSFKIYLYRKYVAVV